MSEADLMKTGIIIQARMNSSRLPGKAMFSVVGKPSLEWCVMQCAMMKGKQLDRIIIATTTDPEDDVIERIYCGKGDVDWVRRGHPTDLVERYYIAATVYNIDTIVRVTGDCPAFGFEIGGILLKSHVETGADYTEAERCAIGTSCQVWSRKALRKLMCACVEPELTEHMSFFIVNNPDVFNVNRVKLPERLVRSYRLTLDYMDDFKMIDTLFRQVEDDGGNLFGIEDIFSCLDNHPEIARINAHCKQTFDTEWMQAKLKKENDRIRELLRRQS